MSRSQSNFLAVITLDELWPRSLPPSSFDTQLQQVRHLVVLEDERGRRPIPLEAVTYTIGRDPTNSIVVASKLVSRQHAILLRVTAPDSANYIFRIVDGDLQGKRSTNGILINGQRAFSHDLQHGDMISLGGDVKARYFNFQNMTDQEFQGFCENSDILGFISKSSNPYTTLVPSAHAAEIAEFSEAALVRLASYPELTPAPILEIDLKGIITYVNPAAVIEFKNLQSLGMKHPILAGLRELVTQGIHQERKVKIREVEIEDHIYEQSIHYIHESELIRTYVTDITERKRAEEQLRQQAQREAVINRIIQAMRTTMVATEVLQITANLLLEAIGASYCFITPGHTEAIITAQSSTIHEPAAKSLKAFHHTCCHYYELALQHGQQVLLWFHSPEIPAEFRPYFEALDLHTIVITPLIYLNRYLGNITLLQTRENGEKCHTLASKKSNPSVVEPSWYYEDLSLVKIIADQCALAIHQAQLYQQVQELNADLEQQVAERTAELLQKMQELEQLNALKDDFLSTVSHELRTPMANIKMAIYMLRQFPLEKRQERYLDILANECTRETELINDLLDLQRLEARPAPAAQEQIDLNEWLRSVVAPFQTRMQLRQQVFELNIAPSLPRLFTNRHGLERVLAELLNNACKYTPDHGIIGLTVLLLPNQPTIVQFRVSNPSHIPEGELPRIFDKFYRIPNADPWKQGGTGLGLALVKKLVEQLRGDITVASQAGITTFIVDIPYQPPPNS